ncbi:MAG: DNA repair protein RadC [Candidatus Edwardsbacteria bacterium]|nr:DNA repair protein RadC [Candidatus Edwardsbacteria bacterium]
MDNRELTAGHRQRLKEKFRKTGGEGLHDYELLELLLTYALPRRDLKPLAKELIKHFGSLAKVLDASLVELGNFKGIKQGPGILIKLSKALTEYYMTNEMSSRDVLSSPQAVLNFARAKLAGLPHEAFLCLYLNAKNEFIKDSIISQGTVDKAAVYPRRVIKEALDCHAAGLILMHNHPSGHCQPSPEDKALTDSIVSVAKAMDIRLLDHIIVGRLGHYSFAENNLI